MATEKAANDLARIHREVGTPDWGGQFAAIEVDQRNHYNKIWESLFSNVWPYSPLGLALKLLALYPGNKKIIFLVRIMPGYAKRYRAFNALVNAEDYAATKFAISPETAEAREKIGYGG